MEPIIKYIEHKPAEHSDRGMAWIARVWPSSSGKTLYFNDMALKRSPGFDSNHCDLISGEYYWVSGVKRRGSNRHWAGGGPIHIESSILPWYNEYVVDVEAVDLIVIPDIPKPDISKFSSIENKKLPRQTA